MFICHFCSREFSKREGQTLHEKHCIDNPSRVQRVDGGSFKRGHTGKASTPEKELLRKDKLRVAAVKSGLGGRVEGSGRGKKGWYKGFFCDSSWELAYLIHQLDHNANIERCSEVRYYEWDGKKRKYYPDFVVEGAIVEIKGYRTKQWEAKHRANPDVICLYSDEMVPYLSYVTDRYGKDFTRLYGR